jgi:hypothetical protein
MRILLIILLLNILDDWAHGSEPGASKISLPTVKKINTVAASNSSQSVGEIEEVEQKELEKKVESEIEGYHEIKKRIQFLESHLKQHADFNLIETGDLVAAAHTLQTIKRTIIEPLETNLLAVKNQMKKEGHNLTPEELHLVKSVLENADGFLKNSEDRLQQLELIENEWDSQEESEKIRQAAASKLKQQKEINRPEIDEAGSAPSLVRSKKLQRVKDLMFKKQEKLRQMNVTKSSVSSIDIHELKLKLDLERNEDEEPGFGTKRINEALQEAAKKSHEFLDKEAHHGEHNVQHTQDDAPPSWILVFSLAGICSALLFILMLMLCSRQRNTTPWKRNLFKTTASTKPGTYCELDEVKHVEDDKVSALTLNHLSAQPWVDKSWGDWDEEMTQKQK